LFEEWSHAEKAMDTDYKMQSRNKIILYKLAKDLA